MKLKNKIIILLLTGIAIQVNVNAQDTSAMLKEFNKVMSFSVQPYVHYTAFTKMEASPLLQPEDTMSTRGEFYKNETNLYYSNQKEEMYMEDSFFIQINHDRKSIWISKVDVETKDKMNILPLSSKNMQELFRKNYTISKTAVNEQTSRLNFETKQYFDSISVVLVNIGLQYSGKNFIPQLLEMNVSMKQKITDEQLEQFKTQGTDIRKAIQTIDSSNYFVRSQRVTVIFEAVNNLKEKAMQMPSWKEKINYNITENEFSGKGIYIDYEITKTF
jgi:hypothetical protein